MSSLRLAAGAAALLGLSGVASAAEGCAPGAECYRKVVQGPVYGVAAVPVLVRPGRTVAHTVPARFATMPHEVTRRPAHTVARVTPAEYSTVAETVLIAPAHRKWSVTVDAHGREVGCWVTVPARTAIRHRTVMTRAPETYRGAVPAVTAVRHRAVMVAPPSVVHETLPPVVVTHHRRVLVQPATATWQPLSGGRCADCRDPADPYGGRYGKIGDPGLLGAYGPFGPGGLFADH